MKSFLYFLLETILQTWFVSYSYLLGHNICSAHIFVPLKHHFIKFCDFSGLWCLIPHLNQLFLRKRQWRSMSLSVKLNFEFSRLQGSLIHELHIKPNTLFIGLFASASKTSGPPSSRVNGNVLPRACGKISCRAHLCTLSEPLAILYYSCVSNPRVHRCS